MSQLRRLLAELHRRSVWQLLGSYALGSWLVLQLAETLSSLLGLPLWFGSGVVGLLVAGFPLVVLTGLIQAEPAPVNETIDPSPGRFFGRRFFTWRNAIMVGGAVVLMFVVSTGSYLGLRRLGIGPFGTLQAKGVIEFAERVVLADFENRTADPAIAQTVTALFRIDLAQSSALTLLEPAQVAPVLERMRRPRNTPLTQDVATEVAEREGIKAVITGEVLPLGSGFVIAVRLVSVADGGSLVSERATARNVEDIPDAVDDVSARMRERVGESLRAIQGDPPLLDVTTRSLAALRLYAQAERANDSGDFQTAVSLLDQALAEDPEFAMAHRKRGIVLSNSGGQEEAAQANEAFRAAYEHRDKLTERERFLAEAAFYTYVENDAQAAVGTYRALLERYPADGIALNNLAVRLQGLGRLPEAAEVYQSAIDSRTGTAATYSNAMFLFSWLEMHDRVEGAFAQFEEMFPGHPAVLRHGASLASSRFDYERAETYATELLESRRGDPVWESVALFELGGIALAQGRIDYGIDLLVRGLDVTSGTLSFMSIPSSLFRAQTEAQAALATHDDPAQALAILDRALASPAYDTTTGDPGLLVFAQLYAQAGRPDVARSLIAERERRAGPPTPGGLDATTLALTLGYIAVAESRFTDAIDAFRGDPDGAIQCPLCGVYELGTVYERIGQADSAVAVYERYLASKNLFRVVTDGARLGQTLLALGDLYREQGRYRDAARVYSRFVDLWDAADPELQARVSEVRSILDQLSAPAPN